MSNKVYVIKRAVERPSNMENSKIGFGPICFSKMQVKVMERIGEGYSNTQIAQNLKLSRRTVESHILNIKLILSEYFGYKFCDRELVIFSRKMIEDYKEYIKNNLDEFSRQYLAENFDDGSLDLSFELAVLQSKYKLSGHISIDPENAKPSLELWSSQKNGF
jgi:DNA-binding CsgD family transcriptional regulator